MELWVSSEMAKREKKNYKRSTQDPEEGAETSPKKTLQTSLKPLHEAAKTEEKQGKRGTLTNRVGRR